ncbi:hypothetical protein HPB48_026424 [Haemaphysalis longicornis]|uniref:Uncharacterized protein n=1 Tax=Haemaphysalis longicornis TaxID=44386 RepID=A0A9J6HBW2_HAELO|nr:hypothetical protein HPB48_026424 [Haemaphysalis longicornis]
MKFSFNADRSKVVEKQEDLVERLRNVKVVSSDPQGPSPEPHDPPAAQVRLLRAERGAPWPADPAAGDADAVRRADNPAKFTPQALAAQYDLSEKDVHSILKYFRVFNVVMPGDDDASRDLLGFDTAIAKLAPGKKGPTKPEEDAERHKSANEGGRTPEDGKT